MQSLCHQGQADCGGYFQPCTLSLVTLLCSTANDKSLLAQEEPGELQTAQIGCWPWKLVDGPHGIVIV